MLRLAKIKAEVETEVVVANVVMIGAVAEGTQNQEMIEGATKDAQTLEVVAKIVMNEEIQSLNQVQDVPILAKHLEILHHLDQDVVEESKFSC